MSCSSTWTRKVFSHFLVESFYFLLLSKWCVNIKERSGLPLWILNCFGDCTLVISYYENTCCWSEMCAKWKGFWSLISFFDSYSGYIIWCDIVRFMEILAGICFSLVMQCQHVWVILFNNSWCICLIFLQHVSLDYCGQILSVNIPETKIIIACMSCHPLSQ